MRARIACGPGRRVVLLATALAVLLVVVAQGTPAWALVPHGADQGPSSCSPLAAGGIFLSQDSTPEGVAVDQDTCTAFVTDLAKNEVYVISDQAGASNPVETIPLPAVDSESAVPIAVAADPVSGAVYVADQGADAVSVIQEASNPANDALEPSTMPLPATPEAIAVEPGAAPGSGTVFVAESSDQVSEISEQPGSTPTTIRLDTSGCSDLGPVAIAVDPDTGSVFIADYSAGDVSVISPGQPPTCVSLQSTGTLPDGIAVDPGTGKRVRDQQGFQHPVGAPGNQWRPGTPDRGDR